MPSLMAEGDETRRDYERLDPTPGIWSKVPHHGITTL
jgi:hypothetical protein